MEEVSVMSMQFTGKYVSLTTFRRDGTPVSTPVWFVSENGSLLVETDDDSYKVKRIRRNHNVTVTSCNATGRVTGEIVSARATILPPEELPRVERLLHRKYRLDYIFVLPIYLLVQRLRGRPLRYEKPVILSITSTGGVLSGEAKVSG
jgi:PPOX class probable F420-dependent enzyme